MQATKHNIRHSFQPTSNTCGYASLAMLLSHYGKGMTTEDVVAAVPQPKDQNGNPTGSITAQLTSWLLDQGYKIHMYTFDFQIIDLSWQDLSREQVIERLKAVKESRYIPNLGEKYWSKTYVQAYIDYLEKGGDLTIRSHVTSKLLYDLLKTGPVYANFCSTMVNNKGRSYIPELTERKSVVDDIKGSVGTHSVVIYGNEENGDFLVADPWDGMRVIDMETMLTGITAAQIECDNLCFQIVKE